jgi:polysaccharide pyruvyl transferase WcaK-like protein
MIGMAKVAIFNDTSANKHYGCAAVSYSLNRHLSEVGLTAAKYWPCAFDWRPYADAIIEELADVSAIVVNGEGTIHHSALRARVSYCTEIARFASEKLNIPSYLINSSISDLDCEVLEDIKWFSRIYVRESRSKDYLESKNIKSAVTPDLSFSCLPAYVPRTERKGILVTDSVFADASNSLKALSMKMGYEFSSMSYGHAASKNILNRVYNKLNPRHARKNSTSLARLRNFPGSVFEHQKWIHKLLTKQFVITGRFHTVTLCLLTGTPFVAIPSNTSKIEALLIDVFGNTSRLLAPEEVNVAKVLDILDSELLAFSQDEVEIISSYTSQAQDSTTAMFEEISSLIAYS